MLIESFSIRGQEIPGDKTNMITQKKLPSKSKNEVVVEIISKLLFDDNVSPTFFGKSRG